MAKTRRLMAESIKLVDAVIEVTDARIPYSSRNPELDKLVGTKPRIVVLNKCDTADDAVTSEWVEYYKSRGIASVFKQRQQRKVDNHRGEERRFPDFRVFPVALHDPAGGVVEQGGKQHQQDVNRLAPGVE